MQRSRALDRPQRPRSHWNYESFGSPGDAVTKKLEILHRIDLSPQQMLSDFSWELPAAPYSFAGQLITLAWAVEVVDENEQSLDLVPFLLSPSGEELQLEAIPDTSRKAKAQGEASKTDFALPKNRSEGPSQPLRSQTVSRRLLPYDPELLGTTWKEVETRWQSLNRRAAITGPHGSGKTTFLEYLRPAHLAKTSHVETLFLSSQRTAISARRTKSFELARLEDPAHTVLLSLMVKATFL